jgi:REDY-like protein HapK
MRIICLFNLKSDADTAAYEKWAREADIPAVKALGSVEAFTVHRATGLFGSDAPSPYQYVEVIDIKTMDGFVGDITTEAFQAAAAPFQSFADNPQFILTDDL